MSLNLVQCVAKSYTAKRTAENAKLLYDVQNTELRLADATSKLVFLHTLSQSK